METNEVNKESSYETLLVTFGEGIGRLNTMFEANDLKANGTGIYQEVFDTVDHGILLQRDPLQFHHHTVEVFPAAYTACATSSSRPPTAMGTPSSSARRMSSVLSGL